MEKLEARAKTAICLGRHGEKWADSKAVEAEEETPEKDSVAKKESE